MPRGEGLRENDVERVVEESANWQIVHGNQAGGDGERRGEQRSVRCQRTPRRNDVSCRACGSKVEGRKGHSLVDARRAR